MGRPEEPLKRDGSPVREFAFWLRDLRHSTGMTYERIARASNYSTSTMQAAASGRQLPTLNVVLAFVAACDGDKAQWETYWTAVKRALDFDPPHGTQLPVSPPWQPKHATSTAPQADLAGRNLKEIGTGISTRTGPAAGQSGAPSAQASYTGEQDADARHGGLRPGEPADTDAGEGWYVESFHALLRMDLPQPEAIEDRVIVATADGLRELVTSISVPRHPLELNQVPHLEAELLYGGSLQLSEQPYENYFRHVIALARPLTAGERHKYRLRLRVPQGQRMAPQYVYMPLQRTDHFELRARFGPEHLPAKILTISGTPPLVLYEGHPVGTILVPDRFGEVQVEYRNLRLGLGYGIHWQE